jgi:hypothetical protein
VLIVFSVASNPQRGLEETVKRLTVLVMATVLALLAIGVLGGSVLAQEEVPPPEPPPDAPSEPIPDTLPAPPGGFKEDSGDFEAAAFHCDRKTDNVHWSSTQTDTIAVKSWIRCRNRQAEINVWAYLQKWSEAEDRWIYTRTADFTEVHNRDYAQARASISCGVNKLRWYRGKGIHLVKNNGNSQWYYTTGRYSLHNC